MDEPIKTRKDFENEYAEVINERKKLLEEMELIEIRKKEIEIELIKFDKKLRSINYKIEELKKL